MNHRLPGSILLLTLCIAVATMAVSAQTSSAKTKQQTGDGVTQTLSRHGVCDLSAAFPANGYLRLQIRSGDLRIEGSEGDKIVVSCQSKKSEDISDVKISFRSSGKDGELSVSGGPHDDFQIVVQVPKRSNLWLRMPAGELHVKGVRGSKDVEVHAGDVTVDIGDPDDYEHVDASVSAGEIDAVPFHISKGGLFRSFSKSGPGNYRLHVHVGAGQLTLTSQHEPGSSQ